MTFPVLKHEDTKLTSPYDRGIFTLPCSLQAGDSSVALGACSHSMAALWGDQKASGASAGPGPLVPATKSMPWAGIHKEPSSCIPFLLPAASPSMVLQLSVPFLSNTKGINPIVWQWLWFLCAKEVGFYPKDAPPATTWCGGAASTHSSGACYNNAFAH